MTDADWEEFVRDTLKNGKRCPVHNEIMLGRYSWSFNKTHDFIEYTCPICERDPDPQKKRETMKFEFVRKQEPEVIPETTEKQDILARKVCNFFEWGDYKKVDHNNGSGDSHA